MTEEDGAGKKTVPADSRNESGQSSGEHRPLPKHKSSVRGRASRRIIASASVLSIVAAVVFISGFGFASYAAFGGAVGTALSQSGHSSQNGVASQSGVATQSGPASQTGTSTQGTGQGQTNLPPSQTSPGNTAATKGNTGRAQSSLASTLARSKTVHLVALGDSLTHGLGDASGEGYVGDVTNQFRTAGYTVIQSNLGIDGLTSTGLRKEVSQTATINLLKTANFILISIGGNDLNQAAGLPSINTAKIAKARAQFDANLEAILHQIRGVNQSAAILLIGLYNPYGDIASAKAQTDAIVETWNADEQNVVSQFSGALVVQTYDLFQFNPGKYLYIDHFHPNQLGYERIAARVWQDVQSVL